MAPVVCAGSSSVLTSGFVFGVLGGLLGSRLLLVAVCVAGSKGVGNSDSGGDGSGGGSGGDDDDSDDVGGSEGSRGI